MSDDDFESDKKKILDEQNEDNKTTVKFLNLTDELKQLGVKQLGFRGAFLYVQCGEQSLETVLYRDNMKKTLEYFDEWVNGLFSEPVKQAIMSHISSVWEKEFHQDEHDFAADENRVRQIINLRVPEEDIKFVFDTMHKEAEYDKISINQIFLGMMSAATKNPQGHNINSRKAGVGKSYDLNHVGWFFPDRYVKVLAGASSKAFLHKEGEMVLTNSDGSLIPIQPILAKLESEKDAEKDKLELEKEREPEHRNKEKVKSARLRIVEIDRKIAELLKKQKKFIDLDNMIIILQDTPQDSFFDSMMTLISQDSERDQEYIFTEQSGKGKFGAKENILHGMPLIFTTRVIDDTENKRFAEKNRRLVNVNPNVSEQKNRAANALIVKKYGFIPEEYDEQVVSRDDKQKAKKTVEIIFEKIKYHSSFLGPKQSGIKLFFGPAIANAIPGKDPWSMTVTERIMKYLSVIAKIHQDSRPRLVNKDTRAFYIISTFDDLRTVLDLMDKAGSSIRPYQAEWYEKDFVPAIEEMHGKPKEYKENGVVVEQEIHIGLTAGDFAERTGESAKRIKDDFLYPLYNSGLIDCVKSVLDRRENLWFSVDSEDQAFSLFKNQNDKRLTVNDQPIYPHPIRLELELEESTRRRKIYYSEIAMKNKKNISEIYSLQDCDKTEISVKRLIDKYLSNPESCFIPGFARLAPLNNNISYSKQIILDLQKKYFFTGQSPNNKFTEFSKNQIEDSSTFTDDTTGVID